MASLVNHSNVKEKARLELDKQIGQDHLLEESETPRLQGLKNVINESFRLYPIAPLLLPHFSSNDCIIGGYDVSAGTMVFTNAWQVHRDPRYWDDPESFRSETFENGNPRDCKLLVPFGIRRRACPGEGLAHRVLQLTLGSLVQCFEWKTVDGKEVDINKKLVISISKTEPLVILSKPRPFLSKLLDLYLSKKKKSSWISDQL